MREQVEKILTLIRPVLALHRGDIELVSCDEETGRVTVRFKGTCEGCSMSSITLKQGIEAELKEQVPGVQEVVAVP